ncbi:lipopolysaccharide biosynthesis protein, partial [Streptomyces sp. NPDC002530]
GGGPRPRPRRAEPRTGARTRDEGPRPRHEGPERDGHPGDPTETLGLRTLDPGGDHSGTAGRR